MMRSWKLGTLFGINVYVHWTFLLVPLIVLFNNLQLGTLALLPYALTLVAAVFGCVVLHEFGHALVARRFGIGTRDITLYPIGGVARLERMSERPWEEFWIAVAGPAVNVVIAALLVFAVWQQGALAEVPTVPVGADFLLTLAFLNAVLVGFNMLPAFPSDGGRVLRALLATQLGRLRATEIAAKVGIVTAVGIGFVGAWHFHNYLAIPVAMFLVFMGQQELAMVRYQERLRHTEPLMVPPAGEVIFDVPPQAETTTFSGILWDHRLRAWVVWRNGRPVSVFN